MSVSQPLPFQKVIDALLDPNTPFPARYLNRLSDLEPQDVAALQGIWSQIPLRRREALLEDLEENHMADVLQNYEAVAKIALEDKEPGVRLRAISILREYELVELIPTFLDLAEQDPDPEVRANATAALGTYVYMGEVDEISTNKLQRIEELLLRLVSGEDTNLVQRRALEALGFSSRQEVNDLIERAYQSNDLDWLVSSLLAMGRSANAHWNQHVLSMLTHAQPVVRAEAASAAGELEITACAPQLLELLEDADIDVRMAATWALSQVGGKGVRAALENQLENTDDDEEAEHIEQALENLEFTDELRDISLMEIPGVEDDSSEEDDEDDSDLYSEDGEV